jgi:hypothetical protein
MGVRTYDPARGVWMSPDLYIGQNFQLLFKLSDEANLFQYSGNNPVGFNDETGEQRGKIFLNPRNKLSKDSLQLGSSNNTNIYDKVITSPNAGVLLKVKAVTCAVVETLTSSD